MKPYYQDEAVTIYHGDCREILDPWRPAIDTQDVRAVIVDPPYGDTSLEWDRWVDGWPVTCAMVLPKPISMWCFGSLRMFMTYGKEFGHWKLAQEIVWEKHNGSGFHADRFKRVHELVVQWYRGEWGEIYKDPPVTLDASPRTVRRKQRPPHTGHIEAGSYTSIDGGPRLMRSVLEVRSCHGTAVHPTQKPTGILTPLITYSCPRGGTVLDPFMGSGSTLVAARDVGRKAIGIEIEERYCEIAARRMAQEVLAL